MYESEKDVDLYVGLLFEEASNGAQFGPTNQCINTDQFIALKKGDKFFYTNNGVFNGEQLKEIRNSDLAKVMCTQLEKSAKTTKNPFIKAYQTYRGIYNEVLSCTEIGKFDFSAWREEKYSSNYPYSQPTYDPKPNPHPKPTTNPTSITYPKPTTKPQYNPYPQPYDQIIIHDADCKVDLRGVFPVKNAEWSCKKAYG